MTTHMTRQAQIQRQLPEVREIFARHEFASDWLDELTPPIEHFEIRIPLIGAFSCGKSSLLNALIGEPVLATAITPETAIPAELRHSSSPRFAGCLPDGRRLALSASDLQDNLPSSLQPDGWLEIGLPAAALAKRPRLVLVDLPGWSSGVAAHEQVIDNYASRSLAYCVVVSVEDGGLHDSMRKALLELAIARMPVVLVISKTDKRPAEDVAAVTRHLSNEIRQLIGQEPLAVAVTSARKKNLGELENALDALDAQADAIFEQRIVDSYRRELQSAGRNLGLLANHDNKDAARIQAEIEALELEIRSFDNRLQRETEALEAQVSPILGTIRLRVENALSGRIEMLTDRALAGQDIGDDILGTARLVMSEALRQEFEPAMQRYLDRLADALPSRLDFNLDLGRITLDDSSTATGEFRWKSLAATLGPLLLKIPHPLAKLLAPVALLLGALFDRRADRQRQQIEAARQREQVRSSVHNALGEAIQKLDSLLRPALQEQVRHAQTEVARSIEAERQELKNTLSTLSSALQQGEQQAAELRQRAQRDLERLSILLAEIAPTPQETTA